MIRRTPGRSGGDAPAHELSVEAIALESTITTPRGVTTSSRCGCCGAFGIVAESSVLGLVAVNESTRMWSCSLSDPVVASDTVTVAWFAMSEAGAVLSFSTVTVAWEVNA